MLLNLDQYIQKQSKKERKITTELLRYSLFDEIFGSIE